jgi:hypothetical protein
LPNLKIKTQQALPQRFLTSLSEPHVPFARNVRPRFIVVLAVVSFFSLMPHAFAESARHNKHRLRGPATSNGFVCGTYEGSAIDALIHHRIQNARTETRLQKFAGARAYAAGNLVVIEDDGTIVSEPGTNAFDLDQRLLHFAPNGSGGYDVTAGTFAFDNTVGTVLGAGDDTNHQIAFSSGFTFTFAGQTWNEVWIRSNANVTFGGIGNPDFYDPNDFFLDLPMIAALFVDLNPLAGGRIHYRQAADRFVITWENLPEFDNNNSNTVQLTLFANGEFDVAYNGVAILVPINGLPMIVGLTRGDTNAEYQNVNLSNLPITGSSAAALFEDFERATYREVDIVKIAQRFYAVQPDSFDQLVLITDFDLLGAPFGAFYAGVQNSVRGIGLGDFNVAAAFGSAGRLQGFLHMNHVNAWPDNPQGFSFLNVLGQEAEHEWGAFVRYRREGSESDLILGRQLAHWSFYLETDGSVMEGNGWRDNGNGSFTTVRAFDNFSLLDHYLMGFRPAEEIAPTYLLEIPGVTLDQRSQFPQAGTTVSATKRTVTVADIIAVEGPRIPSASTSPKVFRQGYVYLLRKGATPRQQDLDKADRFRASWPDYFSDRTDGRGIFQTQLGPELPVATVQGNVTSALNGSVIKNLEARLLEKNFIQPIYDGGKYAFRSLAASLTPTPLQATIALRAYPFLPDTSSVAVNYGATVQHNRQLQPLPQSALQGKLQDASGRGVAGNLTLYVSSDLVDDFTLTTAADAQGNYAFNNLYISSGSLVQYDRLVIEPDIPYVAQTVTNITINAGAATVINATLEPADLLLVNDDPNGAHQSFYQTSLQTLGLAPYIWPQAQRGVVPLSKTPLLKNKAVIWYTGSASGANVLTKSERDSISAYLDRGGRLFLTGQNIAESLAGDAFLAERLHVSFLRNLNDPILHGVKGDPVGGSLRNIANAGSGGANNQNSRDHLQPDAVAQACVVFDTVSNAVAGVRVEDRAKGSRLVFFGFGAEAIVARTNFASRESVLRSVIDWLNGTIAVEEQERSEDIPGRFALSASYPNPLHAGLSGAATVIRYQLPQEPFGKRVTLRVYDVLGREVATLVDAPYQAGQFTAQWSGLDQQGKPAVSGVYFYKLEAGAQQVVRKLVLVR